MSALADGDLVRRAQRGDKDAFAELFTRYEGRIFGYLYRMVGDRAWAEDLTQEAFIRAHQHLGRLGPPYDFKSWLYRIAGNLALDGLRRYRREVPLPDWDSGAPEPVDTRASADPEQQARQAELRAAVWRTLHRLPDTYRQALLLRELEGLSYGEMASTMGISLDNVRVVLHRARLAFRDLYGLQVMAEEGRLACDALNELLSAEVDGELDRAARRRVRQHIAACPVCQRTRKELLTVSSLLAALVPVLPPPTLRPTFLARLRQWPPSGPPPPPAPPPGPTPRAGKGRWVALAVIGGVILLALGVLLGFLLLSGLRAFLSAAPLPPSPSPTPAVLAAAVSPTSPPTDTAVAPTALPTRAQPPTPPPTPTPSIPDARWGADVTGPDNTALAPGTPFVKTWRVRNAGTCAWEPGTRLVFISGAPLGGPPAV
ncbi:MAG: sigma-70 family RNA polymerase sigma factor, partial [Anaerolineae bacterium]